MKGGYESLTWIQDDNGKEYVCSVDNIHDKIHFSELTEEEKKGCFDVNNIVGTERW